MGFAKLSRASHNSRELGECAKEFILTLMRK
jgi:hypothetical protein